MAHADYDCCAICDSKITFNVDAEAKTDICDYCRESLHEIGVSPQTVKNLKDWIRKTDHDDLLETLTSIGFWLCSYSNDVDNLVKTKLTEKEIKDFKEKR